MWTRPQINITIIGVSALVVSVISCVPRAPTPPSPPEIFSQNDEVPTIHGLNPQTNIVDDTMFYVSDDFQKYHYNTVKVTQQLIDAGKCSIEDLKEQGGWTKSVNRYKKQPIYFMYCKNVPGVVNYTLGDKIYANLKTGEIM